MGNGLSKDKAKSSAFAICTAQFKKSGKKIGDSVKSWQVLEFSAPITESAMIDDDFIIRGTAINETTTHNNHKYIAEELQKAASGLMGKPLLVDHENSVESIKGRVTDSMFDVDSKSIKFEAKVMDKKIREMIKDGRINSVSIGAFAEDLVKDEDSDSFIAKGIKFAELSLVAVPGDENANFGMAFANNYDLKEKMEKSESNSIIERGYEDMEQENSLKVMETETKKLTEENTKLQEQVDVFMKVERSKLEEEYKKLCTEKNLKEKDVSKVSNETINLLIEQLQEIEVKVEKVEEKVKLKAEVSEKKEVPIGMENLVFENSNLTNGNAFWVMPDSKGKTSIKW